MKKWILPAAVVIFIGALGYGSYRGYQYAMKRAWIHLNEYDIRSEGVLQVGDLAPDLELESVDGSGLRKLSDYYREKPLVLILGSYT